MLTEIQFDGTVEEPLNREPPPEVLIGRFISKEGEAYDRNHGPIPHIDASEHLLHIDGSVSTPLSLPIHYLRTLPQHTVLAALQCAGNRRHTMRTKEKEVWGIDWHNGAVMNASWTGVLLSTILSLACPTIDPSTSHVAFSCYQTATQDDGYYGGSIPLSRALDPKMEVLIALKMNDRDLTPERGYPVRMIIPGVAGARAVKWLDRITIQKQESSNAYQQKDYKILPPEVVTKDQAAAYWHKLPSILETPINSVICSPSPGAEIDDPRITPLKISGYALPQGCDGPITKVELSHDDGVTWEPATLLPEPTKWSWALWEFKYSGPLTEDTTFMCKATDKGGNTQTIKPGEGQWNLRGVGYNAFGEVAGLKVKPRSLPGIEARL
ncbi:hypothetical protein TWF481_011304 [Arthrobotrys musiformis]|uniref:Sulfite oxidase n=1 Tax=Arthrobotrys musiformis TaxID=47236 RepID=A0AAV9VZT0_9PEZI